MSIANCPCGSGRPPSACCTPYLDGAPAPTAAALMRSRYTAYTQLGGAQGSRALAYLLASWHTSTRPATVEREAGTRWLGLTVKSHRQTGPDRAEVEFVARYRVGGGSAQRLEERSRFVFENGRWFYVDGVHANKAIGS